MTSQVTTDVVAALEESRGYLLQALAGLSDEQARRRPPAGGWSALECIEHIALSEARLVGFARSAGSGEPPAASKAKEAQLVAAVTDRTTKRAAPDPVQPAGRFATVDDAVAYLSAGRSATEAFATETGDALYAIAVTHPAMGLLNGVELLMLIAGHTRRHADQIREIRAFI